MRLALLASASLIFACLSPINAQVTTATLYGSVQDSSSAAAPNAKITATNQATNVVRDAMADTKGEFTLTGLPVGRYTIRVELAGFKTHINDAIELSAGQTVRQTFTLEVGQISENVTVSEAAPLVETASAAQQETLGTKEVRELPLPRRNITNLLSLTTGVTEASTGLAGGGNIRMNGVAEGGTSVTVDGTDATANNETRGLNSYGAQNQISIMSIEAVAEVQVVKGIMPAEYGGAAGGQVNMITRSGSNAFHGSLFENWQNEKLFARDPFLPLTTPKPSVRFNQFGGSLGGAIIKNRAFFFTTYEGYRERFGLSQEGIVPTQSLRDRMLAALPTPATKAVLDSMPLPIQTIFNPDGTVNNDIGRFRDARPRSRHDNTLLVKGDVLIKGGNLSVTFSRMRPNTVNPSIFIGVGNNQNFINSQDRIATQYVLAGPNWASETRFGWNRSSLDRVNDFWSATDPNFSGELNPIDSSHRIPQMTLTGGFTTAISEILAMRGRSWSLEQKFSKIYSSHNVKVGFRWGRAAGSKNNPQTPNFTFQTVNDLLANIPTSMNIQSGQPPHDAHIDDYGIFIQDDWRVNKRFVLNLGMRLDFYPAINFKATSDRPAEIVNLASPTDLNKMDFGAPLDPHKPYSSDWKNIGPRIGFTWTLDEKGTTVIRGGTGVLNTPILLALIQNNIADPLLGAATTYNRTDLAARNLKWGSYAEDVNAAVLAGRNGQKSIFSLIDPKLRAPYTIQTMFNIQHSFARDWMVEAGYIRTDGQNFPLSRPLSNAFDRQTGVRPNPALGTASGVYLTNEQTMVYNALQASVRKRFGSSLGLGFHYTYSRGWAEQGGSLASNFVNSDYSLTQDFFNPFYDRSPLSQEARNRVNADVMYQLPFFKSNKGILGNVLGGWQISGILSARTGTPLRITQASNIGNSRPDLVGSTPVLDNYRDTLQYLDRSQFALVPTTPTGATVRSGNANPSLVRGPGNWTVSTSFGKGFVITEKIRVDVRADAFNALNHVNYNNPTVAIQNPQFGLITGAVGPRTAQLSARLSF